MSAKVKMQVIIAGLVISLVNTIFLVINHTLGCVFIVIYFIAIFLICRKVAKEQTDEML